MNVIIGGSSIIFVFGEEMTFSRFMAITAERWKKL